MDLVSFIGLFTGLGAVWFMMVKGNIVNLLFDLPSLVLVLGGTFASTMMTYPWDVLKKVPGSMMLAFFPQRRIAPHAVINRLCDLSDIAMVRGVDVLSDQLAEDDDDFLKSGVKMLLSDWDVTAIKESMTLEIESQLERHQQVQKVFISMGGYAPVYGLLGTLVGVLGLLRYLGDAAAMGNAMTVAIVTTFYGIFYANFIALPTAGKLETFSAHEVIIKQIIMEGIISIKQETMPYIVREKLEKCVARTFRK